MILSDRPRGAATAARPSGRAPAGAAPEPKATCPGCGRPVAMARIGRCVYCGGEVEIPADAAPAPTPAPVPGPGAAPGAPVAALPVELLIALEPRERQRNVRRLWVVRIGAIAVVMLVLMLMIMMSGGGSE
jgi:hypothetical protein